VIDVLVVGGGPVGLATAIGCALAGLSVSVAEPRAAPVDKACGEGVMPSAVRRLASLGVAPDGYPLRGIRYLDPAHQADARFRGGDGLGVRRTVLHAALAARAADLGIPVIPARVTTFERHPEHVTAAGVEARYLVAADGLHSTIRRALEREAPSRPGRASRSPAPRYGLRRHYRVAPWTDLVEVHWTPHAEAYVTPVSGSVIGVALLFARPRLSRELDAGPHGKGSPVNQLSGAGRWGAGQDVGQPGAVSSSSGARTRDNAGGAAAGLSASPALRDRPGGAPPARDKTQRQDLPSEVGAGGARDAADDFAARLSAFPALRDRLEGAVLASEVRGAGPLRQDVRRRVYGRVLLVGDASGYVDALTGEGLGVGLAQAEALAICLAADRPADYERAWRHASGPAWRFTAGLLWSRNQPLLHPRIVPAAQHLPWLFTALVNHAAQA
jgi:flavin-dependent dehydrogenase